MKYYIEVSVLGFLVILILPLAMTLIINKISQKLFFLVPIFEYVAVSLYNAYIYTARGAGFDTLWLIIGIMTSIIFTLILLIIKKQNVLLILGIAIVFPIFFNLLFHKRILTWMLSLYLGVIALSFQKNR